MPSHRCPGEDCPTCESRIESRIAARNGNDMSQRERDRLSDRAADRYEREVLGR